MNVLTNERYLNYDKLSRYSQFPYFYNKLDDKYICGTTSYLKDTTNYQVYMVQPNDTYDSIALRAYGNPTYYWIICSFNHIQDAFSIPIPGSQLKLPVMTDIEFEEII